MSEETPKYGVTAICEAPNTKGMTLNEYQRGAMTTCMGSEEWRSTVVNGYEVSNFGRVRSLPRVIMRKNGIIQTFKGRILKQSKALRYNTVVLSVNGNIKSFYVHRLVAMSFVCNIHNYNEVNHIDENCRNNRADNLEWCTHIDNLNHGTHNRKISAALSKSVKAVKGVEFMNFPSITKAAEWFGVTIQAISQSMKKNQKVKGYRILWN